MALSTNSNEAPLQLDPGSPFHAKFMRPHEIPSIRSPFLLQIIVSVLLITGIFLFAILIAYTTVLQQRMEVEKRTTPSSKVVIPPGTKKGASAGCVISGCNGEVCVEKGTEFASVCIYKEEFACYKEASCTKLPTGECGWLETESLTSCLATSQQK